MKKLLSLMAATGLAAVATLGLTSCGSDDEFKIGVILVGDETEGYTKAHINGIEEAKKELGLKDSQVIMMKSVPEDSTCKDDADELVEQGCKLIVSNSYGHQDYMCTAAKEHKDVQFVAATGDYAAISGLDNFKNAFTNIFEARYVSGVVAGMKLKELVETNKLSKESTPEHYTGNDIKVGYVGAFNYAEVVSGYTAFYLGIKSIISNVHMDVQYTSSWFNVTAEAQTAEALVNDGCVIIGQHADSTGAPSKCEELLSNGKLCYSVGYNVDMLDVASKAALTSATNNWGAYYKYAFKQAMEGEDIATDWSQGYNDNTVGITALGDSCAAGTEEKVAEVEEKIKNGTLHIFDTSTFTENGQKVTSCKIDLSYRDWTKNGEVIYQGETLEAIKDGYFEESVLRSAPYFSLRIDGITEKEKAN